MTEKYSYIAYMALFNLLDLKFENSKNPQLGRLLGDMNPNLNGDKDDGEYNDNMADHLVSQQAAHNTIKNVRNRKAVYGNKIFDYEKPLVELFAIRF